MVTFDLTDKQKTIRSQVRSFAASHLVNARALYSSEPSSGPAARFRSTKPIYEAAIKGGLIKAQVPVPLGGQGGELIDSAIVVEELYAVETSASLTILGTGLGLTPLLLAGTPELYERFLPKFLSGEGAPLASLVFSEPGGSANFASADGPGLVTVARLEEDEFVISGDKIWATNSSGWDDRGADLLCVVCRIEGPGDVRSQVAIVIVTREDIANNKTAAFQVVEHHESLGHTAVNGPRIRFSDLRVPRSNLLAAQGKGADVVDMTFTASAVLVSAMGVGFMRQAFDEALSWAKKERRGGKNVLLQNQSVADLLIKIKTRLEASRALTWQAAGAFGKTTFAAELCYEAKIFGSESAVESVMDAINLVGVSAYSRDSRLGYLLQDVVVLPIFDGGNVGVRRRQIERIFALENYDSLEAAYGKEETKAYANGKANGKANRKA